VLNCFLFFHRVVFEMKKFNFYCLFVFALFGSNDCFRSSRVTQFLIAEFQSP
jgi:hypothetical protein